MVNDVVMGASQVVGTMGNVAGSYAGMSGMVAERGSNPGTNIAQGIPSNFYGAMASAASSRNLTPNAPVGRHKSRGLFDRSTSPRPGHSSSSRGSRSYQQLSLEAHDVEAEFLRRIDRFESELRRLAQNATVESVRLEKMLHDFDKTRY